MDQLRGIQTPNEHSYKNICCSSCRRYPITKTYFHCDTCEDYDICLDCERAGAHAKKTHAGLRKFGEDGKEIAQEEREAAQGWGWGSWGSYCIIS